MANEYAYKLMCDDCICGGFESGNNLPIIGQKIPNFEAEIFHNDAFKKIHFSDYAGKWIVLFFYPADFTFVCPTELEDMAENYSRFQELDVEIISVSTDTVFTHKAWHDHSPAIKKITFPMLADPTGTISRAFGVHIDKEGIALRGTFVIDPEGVLQAYEVNSNSIGRNSEELIRKIQAAQFVREHGGEVCPAKWMPGKKTLKPGIDLVGKI